LATISVFLSASIVFSTVGFFYSPKWEFIMAREVASLIGSGTVPYTSQILNTDQRGTSSGAKGARYGTQVQIANPEDLNSVATFAVSGITVGTTPIEIIGPDTNPLPRCRNIMIQNVGVSILYVGHSSDINLIEEGFALLSNANNFREIDFPLLHNNSVWAVASTGTSARIVVY
jgi:hypothetical protein